ncbi:MAG: PAS domain S-box protein, partial [Minisyncoccia bacterium]
MFKFSFKTKLIIISIIFIFLIGTILGTIVWKEFTLQSRETLRQKLIAIAVSASAVIDVDAHETILTEDDMNSENYERIHNQLHTLSQVNEGVDDIYTMRKTDQKNILEFVVSGYNTIDKNNDGTIELEEEQVSVGEIFDDTNLPDMQQAFNSSSADHDINCDFYGCWLSGYSPLIDKNGTVVGIVGVDISAENILNYENKTKIFLFSIFFLLILLCPLIIFFVLKIMLKPIDIIISGLNSFHKDLSSRIEMKRDDEFGMISNSFNAMAKDLEASTLDMKKQITERTAELAEKVHGEEDTNKAILNILEDTEKEKEKAEELSKIVESANEPIVSKNLEGIVLSWNHGAEDFYGYSEKEMIGQSIKMIVPEEKYGELENIMKEVSLGQKIEHYQTIRKKKDGSLVDVDLTVSPIIDFSDKVVAISVFTLDITKEKELDKQKDEVISFASHQLKNPITATSWNLEMLLDGSKGKLTEKQRETLKEIYGSNKNMLELVTGFLDISKIESEGFLNEKGEVDLLKISDSVLEELAEQISVKKINIVKKYGDDVP